MASERLAATLDELIIVLRGETRRTVHHHPAFSEDTFIDGVAHGSYNRGWNDGWDACRDEVMKIIDEGLLKGK